MWSCVGDCSERLREKNDVPKDLARFTSALEEKQKKKTHTHTINYVLK